MGYVIRWKLRSFPVFCFVFCPYINLYIYGLQGPKKTTEETEVTTIAPKLGNGEEFFAVAHIFASFNDTFVVSFVCFLHKQLHHNFIDELFSYV